MIGIDSVGWGSPPIQYDATNQPRIRFTEQPGAHEAEKWLCEISANANYLGKGRTEAEALHIAAAMWMVATAPEASS